MKDRLHRLQADDDRVGDVRGRGAMIAVELVRPAPIEPAPDLAKAVASAAHQRGVDRADLRHIRQRAALPAAAGDRRRPAHRRARHPHRRFQETDDRHSRQPRHHSGDAIPAGRRPRRSSPTPSTCSATTRACTTCSPPRVASSPSASRCAATTAPSRCSPATGCSTTTRAARPRAACATARTSTSTRCARWPCG